MKSLRNLFLFLAALFLSGSARAAGVVSGPLVVSDRWPECTNLSTWVNDVMRLEGFENASETAQGKVLFRWLRLFNRMATGGMIQSSEGPYGKERSVMDSHKQLFVYGWGFCDTTSRIAEAVWVTLRNDRSAGERVCVQHDNGGFHTMYRLRMDGHFGAFDPRYGYYLIERDTPDARILDWDEVGVDENIRKNKTYQNRSGPFFEYFRQEWDRAFLINPRYFPNQQAWEKAGSPVECVFGNGMYRVGTKYHDMDFRLPRGATIERFWDNSVRKFYVPAAKQATREEPFLPSGRFYRVTETMFDENWPKYDPNYKWAKPYLVTVPANEGYNTDVAGGRTIGQAWGRMTYEPDLRASLPDGLAPGATLSHAGQAPYLRASGAEPGEAIFDIYSPYVLVDGTLSGGLVGLPADGLKVEIRALQAKATNMSQPDVWSEWESVHSGPGKFSVALGRERFNGTNVSIHGVYRFQVRVLAAANPARSQPAGLSALRLELYFENGIMSIPQIFAGRNTIHFKLRDASALKGPVKVIYRYQTAQGEKRHEQTLQAADFRQDTATYQIDAPGLIRCNSLSIAY